MRRFAYLFERFPSFGQTFCYREVAELDRQGIAPPIFSIRNPKDEPPQDWDTRVAERVHYLPDEKGLLEDVRRAAKKGRFGTDVVAALDEWARRFFCDSTAYYRSRPFDPKKRIRRFNSRLQLAGATWEIISMRNYRRRPARKRIARTNRGSSSERSRAASRRQTTTSDSATPG